MISERSQMAASYKADGEYEAAKIRNETDKEVSILIGEAEAEARRLQGEGEEEYMKTLKELYNDPQKADFYLFVRELEAMEKSLSGEKSPDSGRRFPAGQNPEPDGGNQPARCYAAGGAVTGHQGRRRGRQEIDGRAAQPRRRVPEAEIDQFAFAAVGRLGQNRLVAVLVAPGQRDPMPAVQIIQAAV